MSHVDTNVGASTRPARPSHGSYADALRNKPPAQSNHPQWVKKCEIIFRSDAISSEINLHVRSSSQKCLILPLPRKDWDPFQLLYELIKTFGPVEAAAVTPTHTGNNLEIHVPDDKVYQQIKDTPIMKGDIPIKAIVPTPPELDIHKVNFRYAPLHFKHEDFVRLFGSYGEILQVNRYYWTVEDMKVSTGEGFIFYRRRTNTNQQPHPIPEAIDLGAGYFVRTKTVQDTIPKPDTPMPANKASTPKLPPPPQKKPGPNRKNKKRMNQEAAKRPISSPGDVPKDTAESMEGVEPTPSLSHTPADQDLNQQQQQHTTQSQATLPEASVPVLTETTEDSPERGATPPPQDQQDGEESEDDIEVQQPRHNPRPQRKTAYQGSYSIRNFFSGKGSQPDPSSTEATGSISQC